MKDENIVKRAEISKLENNISSQVLSSKVKSLCDIEIEPKTFSECQKILEIDQNTLDLIISKNNSGILLIFLV